LRPLVEISSFYILRILLLYGGAGGVDNLIIVDNCKREAE
jgi:hypothetical protein